MVVRVSDKKQTYNNVTKLLVKPFVFSQFIKFFYKLGQEGQSSFSKIT